MGDVELKTAILGWLNEFKEKHNVNERAGISDIAQDLEKECSEVENLVSELIETGHVESLDDAYSLLQITNKGVGLINPNDPFYK